MAAKVDGLEKLERKLKALASIQGPVRRRIREALATSGEQIASQMRAVAPSRTGALRASIKVVFGDYRPDNANVRGVGDSGRGDPDLTMRIVAGDATAFYAAFVEFGTSAHIAGGKFAGAQHPGAQKSPFFFPVYRANRRSVKARLGRAMRAGIKEAVA